MSELVHFVKRDATARTTTSTSPAEVTQYTITYEDLTGAGFAAGDDVIIIVQFNHGGNNASTYTRFQVGFGTTYAGRTDDATSYQSLEPVTTSSGHHYVWIDRRTLVDGEDIYFSLWASANTARAEGFRCIVLKKQDWMLYAEATHAGDAPTSYDTSGASISTDETGDWLIIACSRWLDDSTTADMLMAINDGSDRSEWRIEGEDTENERCIGTIAYRDNLAGSTTVRVRYRSDTSSTHDCVRTALVAINLDKFKDHTGAHTTNTITHSVVDTYQDYATFTDFSHSQTGNVLALGLALHNVGEDTKTPRGRILLDTAEWPAAGDNDAVPRENGTAARIGPFAVGYGSVSSGARDWQFRVTDVSDVTPNYDCSEQIAVLFSLELASAGVSGTIAVTLGAFTSSITGTTTVVGTIANTLGAFTSAITGTTTIIGTMAATLGSFISSITGTTTIVGTMAAVLNAFTSAIQGTTTVLGTIAVTLGNFIANMSGTVGDVVAATERLARRMLMFITRR